MTYDKVNKVCLGDCEGGMMSNGVMCVGSCPPNTTLHGSVCVDNELDDTNHGEKYQHKLEKFGKSMSW